MSSAAQRVHFTEPLATPPRDRPRRAGIRYPRVAQRKGEPRLMDRIVEDDLQWRSPTLSSVSSLMADIGHEELHESEDGDEIAEKTVVPDLSSSVRAKLAAAFGVVAMLSPSWHHPDNYSKGRPRLLLRRSWSDSSSSGGSTNGSSDSSPADSLVCTPCYESPPALYQLPLGSKTSVEPAEPM